MMGLSQYKRMHRTTKKTLFLVLLIFLKVRVNVSEITIPSSNLSRVLDKLYKISQFQPCSIEFPTCQLISSVL